MLKPSTEKLDLDALYRRLDCSPRGLTSGEASARLTKYGPNALREEKKSQLRIFLGYFWSPMAWMIEAAAVMALLVRDIGDFVIIMVLLLFNAGLGFFEEHQASDAIAALKGALARQARALRDGKWIELNASSLVPGDVIRLRLGDVVPADVALVEGQYIDVDQSALTGEALPVTKMTAESAYSGSIVRQGEMVALVTGTGAHTFFGRTAELVQEAGNVSGFQRAVVKVGNFLIVAAVALGVVLVAVEIARGADLLQLAEFVLILLVASVPVAMPAVLSVTMALGAKVLTKRKAIVSRLEAIESMAGLDVLVSDKTGTLTQNRLTLGDVIPWGATDTQDGVVAGALASRAEDRDPIDLAILQGTPGGSAPKDYLQESFTPFDPVTKRTQARVRARDGKTFEVAKGAPQVIFDLAKLSPADREKAERIVESMAAQGFRTLGVARADAPDRWTLLGILPLFDPPRVDSKETLERAESLGLAVKMVTGDNVAIAKQIAGKLGLGTHIVPARDFFHGELGKGPLPVAVEERIERADGFAEVFPEHKYAIVKALQARNHITGMTGDGVNDAPALKQADVGIAVSGATDASRAAAAVVLTAPGLSVIIDGIVEARRVFARMMSYTFYRIAITIDVMVFIVLAAIVYGFFPLTPLMIIALALLDDVPIMAIAFDNTAVAPRPVRWRMTRVLRTASVLGALAVVASFGMMYLGKSVFGMATPQLQTLMFLQLVVGGHFMLFVTRNPGHFWSRPWPAKPLLAAIFGTQVPAVLIAGFGWLIPPLAWKYVALVYVYDFVWLVLQDVVWVALRRRMERRGATKAPPEPGRRPVVGSVPSPT